MPEIKHNFQRGRMNKDLDERIVPNGEYRDALNVEVASSESSNMGSVQTLLGNVDKSFNIPQGFCIGSIADEKNDKLYWLVAGGTNGGDNIDFIAEYDYKTELVSPVVVDGTGEVLKFDPNFYVTGINIIDGMLFWTDDNSEPKRIHIDRCKLGTASFNSNTRIAIRDTRQGALPDEYVLGDNLEESHITVIRKSPPAAPVIEMKDTSVGDNNLNNIDGEIVTTMSGQNPFQDPTSGEYLTDPVQIVLDDPVDYNTGDYLILTSQSDPSHKIRLVINNKVNMIGDTYDVTVMSGDPNIQSTDDLFDVELAQSDALFQFKFPRFAYRYKYEDGEYSAFSPFSEVAFLPGEFDYMPKEGYNLGMVNNLRHLVVKNFVYPKLIPDDVISIDILYKESNSPSVYSVMTIKRHAPRVSGSHVYWDAWNGVSKSEVRENGVRGFLRITTEMIHAILPSNQMLRPWDNVPRKALAQEISGNRLIYGNYLQNYNLSNATEKDIDVKIKINLQHRTVGTETAEEKDAGLDKPYSYGPSKSIKSLRTYQIGVVYIDEYGRETPVFSKDKRGTNDALTTDVESNASLYVDKANAVTQNKLKAQLISNPPDWAKTFKFFVKETSNEYYNMAMDRWYNAEDNNIWISFPSAERNKIDEDTFLILKKEHDNDKFVDEAARYKVIAIENEAPYFIKLTNVSMGTMVDNSTDEKIGVAGGQGFPLPNGFEVYIKQSFGQAQGWLADSATGAEGTIQNQDISQIYFRLKSVDKRSDWYRLDGVSTDMGYAVFKSDKIFGDDMSFTSPDLTWDNRIRTLELEVVKRIPEDKPEFDGRFFVKILKDFTLINRIIKPEENETNWVVTHSKTVQYINPMSNWSTSNWDGYGTDKKYISFSPGAGKRSNEDHNSNWFPGTTSTSSSPAINQPGQGHIFWDWASKANKSESSSNGWFIDAVESFRRFKYTKHYFDNEAGGYRTVEGVSNIAKTWDSVYRYHTLTTTNYDLHHMQVCGLNTPTDMYTTIGQQPPTNTSQNSSGNKKKQGGSNGEDAVRGADRDKGGKIPPSIGINREHSVMHISIAGVDADHDNGAKAPTGSVGSAYRIQLENNTKNASDLLFINELTTPGTVFQFKEDPGEVKYIVTQPDTSPSSSFLYDTDEWHAQQTDYFDGGVGVGLYNYSRFNDYLVYPHHEHKTYAKVNTPFGSVTLWQKTKEHCNFASQAIGYHSNSVMKWCLSHVWCQGGGIGCHKQHAASNSLAVTSNNTHDRYPNNIWEWSKSRNKRRRFVVHAVSLDDPELGLGEVGPHYYLPTNNPDNPAHFNSSASAITSWPTGSSNAGTAFANDPSEWAPGVRHDGVYSGYTLDNGTVVPNLKKWDATVNSDADQSIAPGSFTLQVLFPWDDDGKQYSSNNPAIFETEPKEDVGLDIYHEIGQIYPIQLEDSNIEQFVGPVDGYDLTKNSFVKCWGGSGYNALNTAVSGADSENIRVSRVQGNRIQLHDVDNNPLWDDTTQETPLTGDTLVFLRADGSTTESTVSSIIVESSDPTNPIVWYELYPKVHNNVVRLPWFNCYSFGNGVESNRIRDDFNQVFIDKGPKASTTLEQPYLEERRCSGMIHSGIYNSTSGINELNQFIQAEPITKDLNPIYGCIQKLHTRNTDIVTLCEDKIFRVLANKDALYNADGNPQLTATNRVLGQTVPFVGEYGISKNPESFASEGFRAYFTDVSRGAVLRLSQDGLTPISDAGMKDWFADHLRTAQRIIGSVDDKKSLYNVTIIPKCNLPYTVSERLSPPVLSDKGAPQTLGQFIGLQDLINPYNVPEPDNTTLGA